MTFFRYATHRFGNRRAAALQIDPAIFEYSAQLPLYENGEQIGNALTDLPAHIIISISFLQRDTIQIAVAVQAINAFSFAPLCLCEKLLVKSVAIHLPLYNILPPFDEGPNTLQYQPNIVSVFICPISVIGVPIIPIR